jgi:drug/metabolite transporter (DMT)-like permease
MDDLVFAAVLVAAMMHAGWNAIVKIGLDRFSSMLLIVLVQGGAALLMLPLFAFPAAGAWPWLAAAGLLHTGYVLFLIRAYAAGDLSQIYPLSRGTAPLLVALLGVLFLGELPGAAKLAGVVAIALGVMVMSLRGGADLGRLPARALGYALGTACFTAAYTLVDAVGARLSGTASGYTMWMFVLDGMWMLAYALSTRGRQVFPALVPAWRSGLVAGLLSLGSYWIAIWAFTRAPVAIVSALRETSILFAMLIGILFLGEKAGGWRWIAAGLIVGGILLLRS